MINKKYLIHKLYELPEITEEDYLNLIHKKNKTNNQLELSQINDRINLYNEKKMIINLIKTPYNF
jgi:hypothetical protein